MINKIGKILFSLSLLLIININKVNAAEEKLLSELILGDNNKNVITTAPNFSVSSNDKGLYVQEGDATKSMEGKPTYYYRGAVENNYIKFGTHKNDVNYDIYTNGSFEKEMTLKTGDSILWRIVRINEDGSIRLITENSIISNSNFNSTGINGISKYINDNNTNSTIKEIIDEWYYNTIKIENLDNKVVTTSFCNDISGIDFNTSGMNYGNAYYRLTKNDINPFFTCPKDAIKIYSKVGMITADEIIYGGALSYNRVSNKTYLDNHSYFWTLTPATNNSVFKWMPDTYLNLAVANQNWTVRAVINLDGRVMATGTGTENDPYVINNNLYGEEIPEVDNNETENNTNIKIDSNSKKDKIDKIVKDNPTLYFEVEENNIFPGKVTINVSEKYSNGSKLWLYKYNKDTNKIEYVKNEIEVKNEMVTINIDKTGEYFLTLNEIDSSILGEQLGINLVFVIVFLSTILIGGTYALIYTYKLQKNRI